MKIHITLSMDQELVEKAREKNINLSGTMNGLLKEFMRDKTLDFEKQNFVVKCSNCGKEITEGWFSKANNLILCKKCVKDFDFAKLQHESFGEGYFDKFPGPNVNPEDVQNAS